MRRRTIAEVFQIAHLLFEALDRGPKPDLGLLTNYEESVVKRQVRIALFVVNTRTTNILANGGLSSFVLLIQF
jgi:hypothetical protein